MTIRLSKQTREDLKGSNLKPEIITAMQIRDVDSDEMFEIYKSACKAINKPPPKNLQSTYGYEIPYFGLDGKPNGFCRYKLFGNYIPQGAKRAIKYLQLPGTKPHFYLPPLVDWEKVAKDASITVYFVEGEKKAAALTQLGYATIGLGGVWSWRTLEDDDTSDLIADFNLINWKNRKTVMVFDADV